MNETRRVILTLLALAIITPLGFFTKFYSGPAANWVSNSFGGVLYEVFWCLILFLIFRKLSLLQISMIVFVVTCFLEFSQLWKPHFLQVLREHFIVRTLIGSSFTWFDFPYYMVGSLIGYILMKGILKLSRT